MISYCEEDGETWVSESSYDEITGITPTYCNGLINGTEIWIHHDDPNYDFVLYFSEEEKLGQKIAAYIEECIAESSSDKSQP